MTALRRAIASLLLLAPVLQAAAAEAAVSLAPQTVAAQRDSPFLGGFLKETRVIYPLRIGAWEMQGEQLYDEQHLGASVRYRHAREEDRWIDLYFYPAGALPESRLAADADNVLEGIRLSAAQPGGYSEVDIARSAPISFAIRPGESKEKVAARSTSMRLVRDGKAYSSAMVLLVKNLYYIKGRFSTGEDVLSRRDAQRQLEEFMAEVVRSSTLYSTGDCWMAPPIVEKQAPLATGAPGQLASSEVDGVLAVVAYADHIEAVDPQSPQATLMQYLAMDLTERTFDGCVPAEDMNPSVPEGMREIRLEFRAPPGEGDSQSVPLRQSAIGVS